MLWSCSCFVCGGACTQLLSACGLASGGSKVTIVVATQLPGIKASNAYANSYWFDSISRRLAVRRERFRSSGELMMVLVHAIAHIQV